MPEYAYQHRYKGRLKAAILDWAGTTIDYGCLAPTVVFVEVFRRRDVPISSEEARIPMGAHKKEHIRQISQLPAVATRWQEVHKRACTDADVEAMYQDFIPRQLDTLAKYADLIPGTNEAIAAFRKRGMKIGSTTGYTGEMMEIVKAEAKRRGYEPDSTVSATDVPAGRPEPWMSLLSAQQMRIFPMEAIVKIGDTLPDIYEGLNAGMWTIGLVKTGNEIGLSLADVERLPANEYSRLSARAYDRMAQAGAHYVVDSISDVLPCLDEIEARLARGERP
ncbi:MAG: phosphonoacetaldehyde hydrolase [Pirellulales bacterium]